MTLDTRSADDDLSTYNLCTGVYECTIVTWDSMFIFTGEPNMAKGLTPQEVAAKWRQNLSNAGPAYKAGVQRVTVSPTAAAKKQAEKMVRELKAAVDSGRYAAACDAVSLPDWQSACIEQGTSRLVDGAAHGETNALRFLEVALPVIHRIAGEVKQMPNSTEAERDNRALAMMRGMRKFKYTRRRGS